MRTLLSVLFVTVGLSAQASGRLPGRLHVWACHDVRNIADAGYYVNVDFVVQRLVATFGEQSFAGPRNLGSYVLADISPSSRPPMSNPIYVDKETAGSQFTLVIKEGGVSRLRAKDSQGNWHSARLKCFRTK
jgi:hypothetical protein